jgi:hypothetical protein
VIGNAPPCCGRFAIVALLVLSSCAPVVIGGEQASVARVTEVRIQISPERAVATLLISGKTAGIPFVTDLALIDPAGEQDVKIIPADPPVTWSGDGQHFSIKLLSASNAAPTTRYSISEQGLVTTG